MSVFFTMDVTKGKAARVGDMAKKTKVVNACDNICTI